MYIKKENPDEEEIVPSFPMKMELPNDSLDIKDFKAEETLGEFLEGSYSDTLTLEPIKEPLKPEPSSRTSINVGSNELNSNLNYLLHYFFCNFIVKLLSFYILQLNSLIQ